MGSFVLEPINDVTRGVVPEPKVLSTTEDLPIGRAATNSIKLQATAVLYSSKHCKLTFKADENQWYLHDSSTNGSFIQAPGATTWMRVAKGGSAPVIPGSIIRLSSVTPEIKEVIQFRLIRSKSGENDAKTNNSVPEKRKENVVHDITDGGEAAGPLIKKSKPEGSTPHAGNIADKLAAAAGSPPATEAAKKQPQNGAADIGVMMEMTTVNEKLRKEIGALVAQHTASETKIRELEDKLAGALNLKQAVEKEGKKAFQDLKKELATLKRQSTKDAETQELNLELLRSAKEKLEDEVEEARSKLAESEAKSVEAVTKAETLQKAIQEYTDQLLAKQNEVSERDGQIEKLKNEVKEVKAVAEKAQAACEEALRNLAIKEQSQALAKEELERIGTEGNTLHAELAQAHETLAELKMQFNAQASELAAARALISTLQLAQGSGLEKQHVLIECVKSIEYIAADAKQAHTARNEVYKTFMEEKEKEDRANEAMMKHIHLIAAQVAALQGGGGGASASLPLPTTAPARPTAGETPQSQGAAGLGVANAAGVGVGGTEPTPAFLLARTQVAVPAELVEGDEQEEEEEKEQQEPAAAATQHTSGGEGEGEDVPAATGGTAQEQVAGGGSAPVGMANMETQLTDNVLPMSDDEDEEQEEEAEEAAAKPAEEIIAEEEVVIEEQQRPTQGGEDEDMEDAEQAEEKEEEQPVAAAAVQGTHQGTEKDAQPNDDEEEVIEDYQEEAEEQQQQQVKDEEDNEQEEEDFVRMEGSDGEEIDLVNDDDEENQEHDQNNSQLMKEPSTTKTTRVSKDLASSVGVEVNGERTSDGLNNQDITE